MQFGQILKNVLDKNQQVWIPTIGLLAYDKATSKLNLDPYDSASDADILSLISDIKQVSPGEAKGILIQEVEALKSSIKADGKFSIDGVGDIMFLDGSYQFESKKTIFPTNFFDKGNFNPNTFSNNTPPVKEVKEEINPNSFESQFIKIETPQKEVEKVEPIKESTDLFSSQLDNLIREVRNEEEVISTPEPIVEESIDEKIEHQEEIVDNTTSEIPSSLPIIEEDEDIEEIIDTTETNFNLTSEDEFDAHYLPEEEIEPIDNSVASEDFTIQHVEEKIDEIVIDEPRRNIGRSRYDDGYYHYSGSLTDKEGNQRWKLVGIISIGIILFGLLGAYIASKFFVKKNDKKVDSTTIVQKADTTAKIDTTKMLVAVDSTTKKDTISSSKSNLSANKTATTTPSLVSETKSTQPTQNKNNKNTPPKTPSSDNISKKSVAVATKSTETKEETKSVVASKAVKSDKKEANPPIPKDTSTSKKSQKVEKTNIIGKPYATANYTKGNYYLSFGKFKIASAAAKLKKDMKQKAGVETDIILLDGAYRVVIPYVNKEKAQTAAQDFPSTTLFE